MTQMARTTPDADDDSSTSSFSFNPPHSHTPTRSADVPSSSTFDFPPRSDTRFTFNTPPTPPTAASFSFSPPNTSGFTFAFTPSSSADSHSISTPVTQDSATPTRSRSRILTPPSRATTTSTTRALFSALDIDPNSPEAPGKLAPTDHGQFRRSNLSPNANVSTYRDLYNATPSPQPGPSSRPNQTNAPNIDSPSPSSFLTLGVRNLIIQSIETSSTEGEGDDEADSGSDLDSDDGSDNDSSTYNVRDEELPDAPIYNAQLQNSLRDVQSHLSGLVQSMQASQMVHDGTTHVSDLYRQAETESKFEYPQTRIVGFIGDSGVGKSSLINSLLDCGGLARSSGSGEACTSVVTEFRQVDETHPHPYTIEADFMTIDEMIELLRELLMAYRIRHTRAFNEDLAEGESDRITRLSERSWATLQSLFPNEGELSEAFLSNEEPGAEDRILARLTEWAMAGLNHRPGGPDALHYAIRTRDIHDCRENIDILTVASREQERPALWPFVKLIRVYLRSGILRTGLVVADMPGFRDMNYARVRATEKYLRNICDEVFIVSEINRCRSDPSIEEIWHKCIRNQPMRIVCTKSETELDGEEIIRDPKMPARVIAETRRLLDRTEQVRRSLRRLGRRRRDPSGAQQAQYALREAEQNDELGRLELEHKTLLINARNEISRTHLFRKYQTNVKVFCVSRELYENYRGGERGQAAEYIRLSGIPELRQYCQLVPADAQFRETDTFLRIRVPALLGSLNQWVLAGANDVTADRAETLRQVLDEAQRTLYSRLISRRSCIRSIKTELETMFNISTIRYIRDLQVQERWKDGAIRASRDWDSMHHPSYSAFCRKYGVHQIGKESVRYWNNEILQDASEELDQCWSTLIEWLNHRQNTTEDEIYAIFNSVSTSIEAYTHLSPASIENLLDNLDTQRCGIAYTTQRTLEHLLLQTRRITRDVLDGHSSSSYIAEIMRPAYQYCNMESGTGSDRRRKDHMKEYVRGQEIFQQLPARFEMDYKVIISTSFADLERKLNEEVRNITRDLGGVIAVEGEVPEARRELGLAQRVRDGVSQLQAQVNEAHLILNRLRGRTTRSA